MLVLSRKPSETIVSNGPCTVTLVEVISYSKVKLGFEGAPDVQFLRGELVGSDNPPRPRLAIGQSEAQKAGLGEQWQELRRLVDGKGST